MGRRGAGEQTETADARKPWGSLSSLVPGWRSPTMLSVFTTTNNKMVLWRKRQKRREDAHCSSITAICFCRISCCETGHGHKPSIGFLKRNYNHDWQGIEMGPPQRVGLMWCSRHREINDRADKRIA